MLKTRKRRAWLWAGFYALVWLGVVLILLLTGIVGWVFVAVGAVGAVAITVGDVIFPAQALAETPHSSSQTG